MGSCAAEISEALPSVKVHRLMCTKLMKFVVRISYIFPAIESARPRCNSGIEVLCSLNLAMEKAKLLIQHCSECSKLYLAITGEAITMRCKRVQDALVQSLSQIENMVPVQLAAQISAILNDIKDVKFMMESYEEQAGRVLLDLLRRASDATEASELEAFQIAASRLQITSSKAHLIEKRSVKKLLDKVRETDPRKERILNYLLYLLRKYGKSIGGEQTANVNVQHQDPHPSVNSACMNVACDQPIDQEPHVPYSVPDSQKGIAINPVPPDEFMCPISQRIMHDPVIIASGQTFERMWIEKWFNEGHYTCPRTQQKLSHFSVTPNSAMKDLISKWCRKHEISIQDPRSQNIPPEIYSWRISSYSSVASFGSSLNDVPIRTNDSSVSFGFSDTSSVEPHTVTDISSVFPQRHEDHCNCKSFLNFSQGRNSDVFTEVNGLPWVSQYKVMEDVKSHLQGNEQSNHSILCSNFFPILVRFFKDACERCDVKAQKVGVHLLLIFARKNREEAVSVSQEVLHLLVSLLDSEMVEEALGIMQVFSDDQFSTSKFVASGALPSILEILDSKIKELQVLAIKVLCNFSSHGNTIARLLQLGYIAKLVSFLGDSSLAEHCIVILKNMCNIEKGRTAVAEAGCITSIAELLETGTPGEQENAVAILLSLCSHCFDYCHLVMKEGVVPSLVTISINGNDGGKEKAQELLMLLRDITYTESQETPLSVPEHISEIVSESSNSSEKPSSIKARFFGRKIRFLPKPRSLALF